jgi:ribose/xylose/arabinose/galactoside ABC-type transport system permease subunit
LLPLAPQRGSGIGSSLTFVILTGEIDISVGSLLGLLGVTLGILSSGEHFALPTPLVVIAILALGSIVGLANGLLITVGRVPSIIATLGTLSILRGLTDLLMSGQWIKDLPASMRFLGTGSLLHIPISLYTAAIIAALCLLLLHGTSLGLGIRAVGGNPEAVANAGLSAARTRIAVFTLTGLATAIACLVTVPQLSVIESGIGVGFELTVVTAVVVGGTSIRGGLGGITGTVIAVILLMTIRTALVFLDLGPMATYWERAIQGAFILAAVLMDHASRFRSMGSRP